MTPLDEETIMNARVKFATQLSPETLAKLRTLAEKEGRQIQALVEEAIGDLIERKERAKPRTAVMAAYQATLAPLGEVYAHLAK
jgi:predicted transcriptional regulator